MSKIAKFYTPLTDQFKKYLEFRGITEYASVGQTDKSLYASINTMLTEGEVREYFTDVRSTSLTSSSNSFIVNLNIADLDNTRFVRDFRFFNPDILMPEVFNGIWDAQEHPQVKALIGKFTNYCWRLGFAPVEIRITTEALLVRTNTRNLFDDVKKGFSEWYAGENGDLWLRLEYIDLHNKAITEHNHNTRYWFDGHKIPRFHNGKTKQHMQQIIGKVLAQFICVFDNNSGTCREIYVLSGGVLHIRTNGHDGVERRYNMSVADFEHDYKVNILDTPIGEEVAKAIRLQKAKAIVEEFQSHEVPGNLTEEDIKKVAGMI